MRMSRIRATWTVVLLLLLAMFLWDAARPAARPGAMRYYLLLIAQEAVFFGLPALLLRPWRLTGARGVPWRGCLLAALAGAVLALAMGPASAWWASLMRVAPQETILPITRAEKLAMVTAMVVVPALAEEAFFRGGVLCGLTQGVSDRAAFGLTVALFALMHGRLAALPAHVACGMLFTLCMLRYGCLGPPVLAHLGYNAMALLLSWTGTRLPGLSLLATVPALAGLVAAMPRSQPDGERAPLGRGDMALGVAAMAALAAYFITRL